MIEQTASPNEQVSDDSIWEVALTILEQADKNEDAGFVRLDTLAEMTSDGFYIVPEQGKETPLVSRVKNLLRVALSRFAKQHPDLMIAKQSGRTRGGWDTSYCWTGPELKAWPKEGWPMPSAE